MADADDKVIQPALGAWQYFSKEDHLRQSRNSIPNYRLANTMRRWLAGVVLEVSERQEMHGWYELQDLTVQQVRQIAARGIGLLAVRSASAGILLVTSGYQAEATVHLRRMIECTLRLRATLADHSGQHAREWLTGRARPSVEKLAQKFGNPDDLALLSISAHADSRGVAMLHAADLSSDGVATAPLMPHHSPSRARALLYGFSYECGSTGAALAEAFVLGVVIPTWAGDQLKASRDAELATVEQLGGSSS